jgi:hypothetical protein
VLGIAVVAAIAEAASAHGADLGKVEVGTNGGDSGDAVIIICPALGMKLSVRISDHGSAASAEIYIGVVSDCAELLGTIAVGAVVEGFGQTYLDAMWRFPLVVVRSGWKTLMWIKVVVGEQVRT